MIPTIADDTIKLHAGFSELQEHAPGSYLGIERGALARIEALERGTDDHAREIASLKRQLATMARAMDRLSPKSPTVIDALRGPMGRPIL